MRQNLTKEGEGGSNTHRKSALVSSALVCWGGGWSVVSGQWERVLSFEF
jgi:hypothetical protein